MGKHTTRTKKQLLRRFAASLALVCVPTITACRTPHWNACAPLKCLPWSADRSSEDFWNCCEEKSLKPGEATVKPLEGAKVASQSGNPNAIADEINGESTGSIHLVKSIQVDGESLPARTPLEQPAENSKPNPFEIPSSLPGADTPPIKLPPLDPANNDQQAAQERRDAIGKLYPEIRPTPQEAQATPQTEKVGLEELQTIARDNNPRIRAAAAAVEAARGVMIQAGLPPNPNLGYEADTVRTLNTNGYHGAYIQQTLITAKKLGLAAQAAAVDHANASLEMQRTWYEVATDIRRQYFVLLAARKRLQLAEAFLELSEKAYSTQVQIVQSGEAAPYEPLQLRVLVTQARALVIKAQQDAVAAWRVLAASTGVPNLPPSAIRGNIDCPVPVITYEAALARMLSVHTNIRIAQNTVGRNRTLVTLADRKPIPDLDVGVVVQHDYTFDPGTTTYNLMLGGAIPVFDRNQGGRISARADLVRASQNVSVTENELIAQLAPVFATYETNRQLAGTFRTDALQDQVRAYRGVYQRYFNAFEEISFNDVIVAQQTLSATLNQYLDILQNQWGSVVDLAGLLQLNDVFEIGPSECVAEIPSIVEPIPVPTP